MNKSIIKLTVLCFSLITLITVSTVNAQKDGERDPAYIFYKANALYEVGKYDEAINVFTGLTERGLESGNIYFNIGNSYFKKGELGKAILNYERANKLIPGDSDLKSNYDFALSKVKNMVSAKSAPFHRKVLNLYRSISINGLTILLSFAYIVLLSFIFIFFVFKPGIRHRYIFTISLIIFFLISLYALSDRITSNNREAVLISESSDAKFEPVENATIHYTIYEGAKVYIVQEKMDWLKIRRQDGKIGWIKKADSEII
jgi:tetratricopeptide (TPR) repeat protein